MVIQIGLLTALFLFLYSSVFGELAELWWNRYDYSHGFLIPLISIYIIWVKRDKLRLIELRPMRVSGIIVVLLSGFLLLIGEASGIVTFGGISLVMMLIGMVLLLLGRDHLKAMSFPIVYLFFMTPILDEITGPLHWPFQLLSAKMGVGLLQMLAVPALLEGNYIVLPDITLEVARECSGASLLISILAIGLPLAYLRLRRWWGRVTLVISGIAIGIIANWVRVFFIGLWAYTGGKVLHGPFHIFQGMFVAWVGYVALFAGAWGISKVEKPITEKQQVKHPTVSIKSYSSLEWNRSWRIAIVIILIFAGYLFFYIRGTVGLREDIATFPVSIGGWSGEKDDMQNAVFRIKGADHELLRVYRDNSGQKIQLYIAYFESQRQGKEIVNYLMARLHQNAREMQIQIDEEQFISVTHGKIGEKDDIHKIIFWYDTNGRVIANYYQAKIVTTIEALLYGRTNGAFVLISNRDDIEKEAKERFVRDVFPLLRRYLP